MTVFSASCLLKMVGAIEAASLAIDAFELVAKLMEHADSLDLAAASSEQLGPIQSGVVSWIASKTTADLYPTDFGVAVAWNGYHLLSFGDTDNSRWYTKDQLEALEEGQDVEGHENYTPIWNNILNRDSSGQGW